jgi:folate-binding protein YgfZ
MFSDAKNTIANNIQDIINNILSKSCTNNKCNASILTAYSTILITGEDREKFLQGQISANMTELSSLSCKLAVACDYKGRMYTTFRIVNTGENYLLIMHESLIEDTINTLKKYAPFFKVKIERSQYISVGFSGAKVQNAINNAFKLDTLPESGQVQASEDLLIFKMNKGNVFQCLLAIDKLEAYTKAFIENFSVDTGNKWCLNNIYDVIPELRSEISYKYIPQYLNQTSIDAISFRKGCFTGQEIITRTQNLATVKQKTYHVTISNNNTININDALFDSNGKVIGNIIQIEIDHDNKNYEALAVIKYNDDQQIFIDSSAKQIVKVHNIPYNMNAKDELNK